MALKRRQHIFLKQEAQEAAATAIGTLLGASYGAYDAIDPTIEFEVQRIQRNTNRSSLTPAQGIPGLRNANMKFGLEITGPPIINVSNKSQCDLPWTASGLRREGLQKIYIGPITLASKFIHGESVSINGTANAGIVVRDTYNGATHMYVAAANGLSTTVVVAGDGDDIVGATSGASAAADGTGIANAALGYWPSSLSMTVLTIGTLADALSVGDILRGVTTGAMGRVEAAVATGSSKPVYITQISGSWSASEVVSRVSPNADANVGSTTAVGQFLVPTLSGGMTKDGVWESGYGMRGNSTMRFPNGDLPVSQFEMKGSFSEYSDGANIGSLLAGAHVPCPVLLAGFRLGATDATSYSSFASPCAAALELATNNELTQRQCMNSASGVLAYDITGRAPTLTIDPELQPEAFLPILGRFLGSQNMCAEWTVRPVLPADRNGRTFLFQVPNANVEECTTGDRNGLLTRGLKLTPNDGASVTPHDNDFVIVHDFAVDVTSGF